MTHCAYTRIAGAAALAAGSLLAAVRNASAQIPAFSGAEGPGANATGGRGGDVYHVTNLDFDLNGVIPGTLKYGINNAPGNGRTIVFDVGGTIFRNGGGAQWWFRSGKSNITIAGQTAPGPGITIAGVGSKWTGDNVILRNITVRPNKDPVNPTNFTYDAVGSQLTNSIIDHVTATWFTDEGLSQTDAGFNTTVQYALIDEGLNYNGHAFGSIINTQVSNSPLSYHHNLYAHDTTRSPRMGSETGTGAVTTFANNVIYNWISKAGYSALNADTSAQEPSRSNFLNNYYIKGASNGTTLFSSAGDQTQIYQNNLNKYDGNKNGLIDGTAIGQAGFSGTITWAASAFPVTSGVLDTADVALQRVLDYGGANWNNRNPIEQRVVQSVRNGTGAIINDLTGATQAAEWATVLAHQPTGGVAPFNRPAGFDTDQDGMPDAWEGMHGLDPNIDDHNADFDSDGYTNLEEYINELSEWPAPSAITFNAATNNRYAQITNWDIQWQPSKYDTARVNSGTVVVDSVGQHAGTLQVAAGGSPATLSVTNGWIEIATQLNVGVSGTGLLQQSGGTISTPLTVLSAIGSIEQSGGLASLGAVGGAGSAAVSGGVLLASSLRINQLAVSGGGIVTIAPNGTNTGASKLASLTIADAGKLDLSNNHLIVGGNSVGSWDGSAYTGVSGYVQSGRNSGSWNGPGLITTQSDAIGTNFTSLGVARASDVLPATSSATALWAGQTITGTDTLVMYTYGGDSNLDGKINIDDYVRIDAGIAAGLTGWSNGDFNYDGKVNIDDYTTVIDANISNQNGFAFPTGGGIDILFGAVSAIPEPGGLPLLAVGALSLRRRRKQSGTGTCQEREIDQS